MGTCPGVPVVLACYLWYLLGYLHWYAYGVGYLPCDICSFFFVYLPFGTYLGISIGVPAVLAWVLVLGYLWCLLETCGTCLGTCPSVPVVLAWLPALEYLQYLVGYLIQSACGTYLGTFPRVHVVLT